MNICCVLVTYGNRSKYFKKVIDVIATFEQIKNIILVDNCVSGHSVDVLKKLEQSHKKLQVLRQGFNSGSAKGFKDGIVKANELDIDFIWLLDDDNLPNTEALNILINQWKKINASGIKDFALLSYRPDRRIYKDAIETERPYMMLGVKNSFLGFHVIDKITKLFSVINKPQKKNKLIGQVAVAPYGGLFFHKSLVNIIGFPNEHFFLYGDDFDYSYRITQKASGIYLVVNSIVQDLEQSFHLKKENENFFSNRLIKTDSKDRIFYSVRNGIVFEQNFVTNKFSYIINAFFHVTLTFIILLLNPKHLWKYIYYIKGIKASI